jgi:hypothetical protein
MKRRRILVGLLLSPLLVVGLLAWLHRSDTPAPYFPRYPHVEKHIVYPEKIVSGYSIPAWAEFTTHDSAESIRAFYRTTLLQEEWILIEDTALRMIFQRGRASGARDELTIRFERTSDQITGRIYYQFRPFRDRSFEPDM